MSRPSEYGGLAEDVGGPLLVTPAGTNVVSTDALLASADRLRALERSMHDKVRRVIAADAVALGWPIRDDLVPRIERSYVGIYRLIEALDSLALERRQGLTVPLARAVLTEMGFVLAPRDGRDCPGEAIG